MSAKKPAPERSTSRRSEAQKKRRTEEQQRQRAADAEVLEKRWNMARARYEADPLETLAGLAKELGISRQRLSAKASEQGWIKAVDGVQLAQAATIAVTVTRDAPPALQLEKIPPHPTRPPPAPPAPDRLAPPPGDAPDYSAAAVDVAVKIRVAVVERHQDDLQKMRMWGMELMRDRNSPMAGERSKVFQRTVMGMRAIQDGERKAFGLDAPLPDAPPVPGQAQVLVRVIREGEVPVYQPDDDDDD